MKLFRNALAAAASLCLIASPALADITVKDGTGASQTIRGVTCGTGICYGMANFNTSGVWINPATDDTLKAAQSAAGVAPTTPFGIQGVPGGTAIDTVTKSTAADRGAVLTTADTAVTLIPANAARRGMTIENQGTVKCWFSGLGTATEDYHSLLLVGGGIYESRDSHSGTGAISMICNGANVSVYAREW